MKESLEELREEFQYNKTNSCVQCGYCLPVCPTYVTTRIETHSPRGRINLVKMVGEGKITDLSVLEEPLDLCLGCRACETACPTGVEYGSILESARAALVKRKRFKAPVRLLRKTMFQNVFPSKTAMNVIGNTFWLYEKSGLQKAMRKTGIMKKLPYHLGEFEATMSQAVSPAERKQAPSKAKAKGEKNIQLHFSPDVSWMLCSIASTGCLYSCLQKRVVMSLSSLIRHAAAHCMRTLVK